MRIFKLAKQKEGFTLVELIVALAIFGIMMVAFLSLFSSALYLTHRAGNRDQTVALAAGKVENKIASGAFAGITPTTADVQLVFGSDIAHPETVHVEKFTGSATTKSGADVSINYYQTPAASPT